MMRYSATMDLCEDYSRMIRHWQLKKGYSSQKTGTALWYEYFNFQKKSISPTPRSILISKEFSCPKESQEGLNLLSERIKSGKDIYLHLSQGAFDPASFDDMLYDWGIYHLHLHTKTNPKTGLVCRSGPVLFALFDDNNAYFINVYRHGKGVVPPWCKQELLKIVHANWPETIEASRIPGAVKLEKSLSDNDYSLIRKNHITTPIEIAEGAIYFNPGGGYMSSGHSAEILRLCDHIHNTLKLSEERINQQLHVLIPLVEQKYGKALRSPVRFMLWSGNNQLHVVEALSLVPVMEILL